MIIDDIHTKAELINIAQNILNKKVNLYEGIEQINRYIDIEDESQKFLIPIKGIWSQADDLINSKNKNITTEELLKRNSKLKEYLLSEEKLIFEVCKEIIRVNIKEFNVYKNSINEILKRHDPIKLFNVDFHKKHTYEYERDTIFQMLKDNYTRDDLVYEIRHLFIDTYGQVQEKDRKIFELIGNEVYELVRR